MISTLFLSTWSKTFISLWRIEQQIFLRTRSKLLCTKLSLVWLTCINTGFSIEIWSQKIYSSRENLWKLLISVWQGKLDRNLHLLIMSVQDGTGHLRSYSGPLITIPPSIFSLVEQWWLSTTCLDRCSLEIMKQTKFTKLVLFWEVQRKLNGQMATS